LALVCLVVAAVAALLGWRRYRRLPPSTPARRSIAVAIVVAVAVWAVPLVHEIRTWPGNLAAVWRFFANASPDPQPWSRTFEIVANQLVGPLAPSWAFTTLEAPLRAPVAIVVAAAAQVALLVWVMQRAARRGSVYESSLAVMCLAATLTAFVAVRRIIGPISDYLVIWIVVVGALNTAVLAAELLRALSPRMAGARWWRGSIALCLVVVAAVGTVRLIGKHAADARSPFVRTLSAELMRASDAAQVKRPLLRFDADIWNEGVGIVLQFYKQRRPISVHREAVHIVGAPFAPTGRESAEFYLMPTGKTDLPDGVRRHEWITTLGPFRLVRVFRE
jgi:hypothetical protein